MENKETCVGSNEKPTCGIIMPISSIDGCGKEHWDEVRRILEESINSAGFKPSLVSDAEAIGIIQKRIVQNIYDNEIVVCDVSGKNPNVMFELGMRLAFDKPTIIVIDDKTNYSFDTAPIEHISYPRDLSYYSINNFKDKLKDKIKATVESSKNDPKYTTFLKNFGEFEVAHVEKKEGSLNDYVLSKLEDFGRQINHLEKIVIENQNPIMENELCKPKLDVYSVARREIDKYCKDHKINPLFILDSIEERNKLLLYLENNRILREYRKMFGAEFRSIVEDVIVSFR